MTRRRPPPIRPDGMDDEPVPNLADYTAEAAARDLPNLDFYKVKPKVDEHTRTVNAKVPIELWRRVEDELYRRKYGHGGIRRMVGEALEAWLAGGGDGDESDSHSSP